MAISIFPSTAAEFVSNNFVVDMNDTSNNTADTGGVKQAGPYSMSFSSGDTSFDVYLIDDEGNSVGYSNSTSITASGLFTSVVILGVATDEIITFNYSGSVNNADGEGDEPGAGAYLESISPSDLPSIDDTATVTGGNFGADTEIKFESGATVLDAKNITVNNSTELIVTRPDNLDPDLDPWTLRAVTTGVPEPTGTNSNILTDVVTAGAVPSWITTSPLAQGTVNVAYSETLEATDADGDVTYSITSGSLPTGLSLDSSTGVISGTPTAGGQTFTVTASDDGGNQATREFTITVLQATGGTISTDSGFVYHSFTSTDDFEALTQITDAEVLIVAGGGAGGTGNSLTDCGGGGAGGLLNLTQTFTTGTYTATVGAGGATNSSGSDSSLIGGSVSISTIGGGLGASAGNDALNGGSGGGGAKNSGNGEIFNSGTGIAGQGFDGGDYIAGFGAGGGGGASEVGEDSSSSSAGDGGDGLDFSTFATATSTGDGGFYAGGGGGANAIDSPGLGGAGGGGNGGVKNVVGGGNGLANTGGGAGGQSRDHGTAPTGGSGIVIVRYAS